MRRRVTVVLCGLIWLVAGLAHADTIGLYADTGGTNCNIPGNLSLTYVYVVHLTEGATASAFMAPKPACWTGATWLYDQDPLCTLGCGWSQTGKMIGYGTCLAGAIHISTIVYLVEGSSEPCRLYPVLPHPSSPGGQVEVVDCYFNPGVAIGLVATVNGNSTCACGYPVTVEETTWGSVKALYME